MRELGYKQVSVLSNARDLYFGTQPELIQSAAQELDRGLNLFTNFSVSFSIISILVRSPTVYKYALDQQLTQNPPIFNR